MSYLIDRNPKMTLWERIYLPEIIRGLSITARHFFRNFFHMKRRMTVEYPEQKRELSSNYRAEPRLMKRENGEVRCTACMLCATVCPAQCISIDAEEVVDPAIEKRPSRFDIDMLHCVFCGLCVEACPCDAIRLDTGKYENASFDRSSLVYGLEKLLSNTPSGTSPLSRAL